MSTRALRISVVLALILAGTAPPALAQVEIQRALARLPVVFGERTLYARRGKENLYDIARRFGVSASALHNANIGDLLAGDELLLIPTLHIAPVPTADGIVVNLTERNLYLYRDGRPVRCFPVAIGMRGWETPTGDFQVVNMRKNPTWFPPKWAVEEKPVPPGPDNPLGDRWMGLSAPGYGIHATNAPSSVGRYVSHGCLRMYPEHAHELYEMVKIGTPVKIVYYGAVVGTRPGEGVVYLAHYPDPYQLGEVTRSDVLRQLADYGLDRIADVDAIDAALQRPAGVPAPIIGSRLRVSVNGRTVPFALGPTRVGADWLVPAGPLLSAMGATLDIGPGASYVVIRRGDQRVLFSPGNPEAIINGQLVRLDAAPQLAAGHPMIPLRATATALQASLGWDEAANALLVWDGPGIRPLASVDQPAHRRDWPALRADDAQARQPSDRPSRPRLVFAPRRSR